MVVEAKKPLRSESVVEVALVLTAKFVVGVKGKAPPEALMLLQPKLPAFQVSALEALLQDVRNEPKSFVVEATPVLSIEKSVEVEKTLPALVEEEIAKSMGLVDEAFASMVRAAYGLEVPRPRLPVEETQVNCRAFAASPKRTVEDAARPPVN